MPTQDPINGKRFHLQIHPDKDLFAQLQKKDPEKFADDNHKPEIAVALSNLKLFVSFKPSATFKGPWLYHFSEGSCKKRTTSLSPKKPSSIMTVTSGGGKMGAAGKEFRVEGGWDLLCWARVGG